MGPRASGKTSVGRQLARRLGFEFVDLDDVTRSRFAEPDVAAIWTQHGEAGWRRAEVTALESVLPGSRLVVALGGGTPLVPEARRLLDAERATGRIRLVYLRCDVDELKRRLEAEPGDRPSLTGQDPVAEVDAILAAREPTYEALADLDVDVTDREPADVAKAIAAALGRPESAG